MDLALLLVLFLGGMFHGKCEEMFLEAFVIKQRPGRSHAVWRMIITGFNLLLFKTQPPNVGCMQIRAFIIITTASNLNSICSCGIRIAKAALIQRIYDSHEGCLCRTTLPIIPAV